MQVIYLIFALIVAVVGFYLHGSIFWSVMDFIFAPIALLKWLLLQQINLTIIKTSFVFFFK